MTSCLSGGFHCRGRSETFYYCCQTQTSVTHVLHAVTCHVAIKETSDCKWTSRGRRPAGGGTHRSSLLMSLPALWKICLCNIFCWNLRVSIVHPVPSSAIWFPHTGTQTHRRGGGGGRREHGRAPPRVNGFSPHWKTQLSQPGSLSSFSLIQVSLMTVLTGSVMEKMKKSAVNSLLSLWILEINLILSQFSVSEFPQSVWLWFLFVSVFIIVVWTACVRRRVSACITRKRPFSKHVHQTSAASSKAGLFPPAEATRG